MATTTTYKNSLPSFVADPQSMEQIPGRQVLWSAVNDTFKVASTGKKRLPAGSIVAELASGKIIEFGGTDAAQSPPEDAVALGILATEANEDAGHEALTGYGVYVGGIVFENLLPDATGGPPKALAAQTKTDLATAKATFKYVVYVDDSAA